MQTKKAVASVDELSFDRPRQTADADQGIAQLLVEVYEYLRRIGRKSQDAAKPI